MDITPLLSNGQRISPVTNPFSRSKIVGVHISAFELRSDVWHFGARVEFKNGQTSGEQKIEGSSMNDVIQKTEAFVKALD